MYDPDPLGCEAEMNVAGGTYIEICNDPATEDLYGSGLRAVAAVSGLSVNSVLHTYVSERWQATLSAIADTFGFSVLAEESPHTPHFEYRNPVAPPRLWSSSGDNLPPLVVTADHILRFGMIEREAEVHGVKVVYDPQSSSPKPFHENGSTAEHLAVVANEAELVAITGSGGSSVDAAVELLERWRCDVVVVKLGARGALVQTTKGTTPIPAFQTPRVWPIGSGDVFSALFAYFWGEMGAEPGEAALRASRGAAAYCNSRVLPIDLRETEEDPRGSQRIAFRHTELPQVYLAGPFFSVGERWVIREVREALSQQDVRVFSPLHDVGLGIGADVAPKDLAGLRESQSVFAIVDGLDAGTIFEIGYARALEIPVVAWTESASESNLAMLRGSGCAIVRDLSTAVYHAAWAAMGNTE